MRRIVVGYDVAIMAGSPRGRTAAAVPRRRGPVALVALLLGTALLNVWLSGLYYRTGYAVSAALEEKRSLEREKDLLKTEILTLRSPARIETIAKARLGMVDPRTDRMIRVK